MRRLILWTDGSCPKPHGPGGYAAILQALDGDVVVKEAIAEGGEGETTNQRMELMSVIAGLQLLTRSAKLEIVLDSQYVMKGFTEGWVERWKRNGWRTGGGDGRVHAMMPLDQLLGEVDFDDPKAVKNRDLWEQLDALVAAHEVAWRWVKGHRLPKHADWTWWHENNVRADELAGAQTRMMKEALSV
jgi:ribonuclease HI